MPGLLPPGFPLACTHDGASACVPVKKATAKENIRGWETLGAASGHGAVGRGTILPFDDSMRCRIRSDANGGDMPALVKSVH
jgi:hypothetical protein